MTSDPTIRAQGYQYFLQEAPELLQVLEEGLLTLRDDSGINKVNTLMRATHTLKGAAASLDLHAIAKVAHSLEDVFRALCRPDVFIDAEVDALLFEGFDCLRSALMAELSETTINEDAVLNRTARIFAQLQDHLGDCFDQDTPPPTSAELGFDVTQSIFEVGVTQRLDQLAAALETEQPTEILAVLQTQAEIFLGLGESLNLPGFGDIAEAAIAALEHYPDQAPTIAQVALQDFRAGQAAVLAGDRSQGGHPSEVLQALVQGQPDQLTDAVPEDSATAIEDVTILLQEADAVAEAAPETEAAIAVDGSLLFQQPAQMVDALDELSALDLTEAAAEEASTEATTGAETAESEATTALGIHKLFRWMRRSIQAPLDHVGEASAELTSPPEEPDEAPQTYKGLEIHDAGLFADQSQSASAGTDADALLKGVWGGNSDADLDGVLSDGLSPAALSITPQAIAPGVNPEPITPEPVAAEPATLEPITASEVLELEAFSQPHPSRPPVSEPAPSNKGAPSGHTVRIQVEHLDRLNYAIGELLTNHNQQSLQTEQIQMAMRRLYSRLEQHQQLLSQLQDWVDFPTLQQDQSKNSSWSAAPASPSDAPLFPAAPSTLNQSQHSSRPPIGFDGLELDQYSEPQLVIQSLLDDTVQLTEAVDAVELFTRQSRQSQEKQGRLLFQTRDALIEGRMFPLGQLFERFPRVLQQLETLYHKPVELSLQGTDVLVDKAIGEKLYHPILHLVRNAFDHGIEPVAVRRQRAKPPTGHLEIAAHHRGKHLVIDIRDDGQGIDFERIRQRAIERQMVSPDQAYRLTRAQLTDLLFEPGFSTAAQISSLSGRGVGLDVVRSQLQALQGEITVTSVDGQGTTFTLRIPLSLTIAKLLLCQADAKTYALLPNAIEQILIPQADQIQQREHCRALWWGEGEQARFVPIYRLSDLLDYHAQARRLPTQSVTPSKDKNTTPHILLIRHQDMLVGIEVEQMTGEQELVIRPLNPLLATHDYIYGASIIADGQLTLVLDCASLAESAERLQASPTAANHSIHPSTNRRADSPFPSLPDPPHHQYLPAASDAKPLTKLGQTLLVVDDSITTRQILVSTLQRAGYRVIQAQDGQEAIDWLLHHPNIQLVICDVEMPRMNGFEFLQHCQLNPDLGGVPVAMLSSRSSHKHRALAEQLGAIAYISKPYLEHQLLKMVAEILAVNVLSPISG
ncbi:MAG: response regulator [Elainellaceae cyanobacterium]